MSTTKREVFRREIQLGSATHIGLFSAPRRAASRNYKGPRRGALKKSDVRRGTQLDFATKDLSFLVLIRREYPDV